MTATSTQRTLQSETERNQVDASAHAPRWQRIRNLAVVLGACATLVSFAGSWIPSFWGDEAASVMSAERPLATLFPMLGHVDAVHGLYYLFLHGWISLFGASELSTRVPSALGVGLAAAGTVVLADLLFTRRIAVIAGLAFAILPRVSYMGAEARSYALGTAIAVWLTVLLVLLLTRRVSGRMPWLLYTFALTLAIYIFLYLILLTLVHVIVVCATPRSRAVLRHWLAAAGAGVLLAVPVIFTALTEHQQIAFLAKRAKFSPEHVFVSQWFGSGWLALLCWALILTAVVVAARAWRKALPRALPRGMILLLAWLVIPTLLLELGNAFIAPMYTMRYLSFCTPAVAILMALGLSALARNWLRLATGALLVGLALPVYLAQRGPYAMNGGSDWRQASVVLGQHARPGDAIVFDADTKPSQRPRLASHLYPADYAGLIDVALVTPYAETTSLWDSVAPLERVTRQLDHTRTVWAMEMKPSGDSSPRDVLELERLGFQIQHEYSVHRTTVYELTSS